MTAHTLAPADTGFAQRMARVEELLAQVAAQPDPAARSSAEELVRLVLELHGAGLARMLAVVEENEAAAPVLAALAADDLVTSLLLIHDLHPVGLRERVEAALESVRPMMAGHSGGVDLLSVEDGIVRLRLEGNCHGCPGSTATMRNAVEEAVYKAAPDIAAIEVDGVADEPLRPSEIDCLKPLPIFATTAVPMAAAPR